MISFEPLIEKHLPLFYEWAKKPHVRDVWFREGYEPVSAIEKKVRENGDTKPFVITLDNRPIGYIQYCDLDLYKKRVKEPQGILNQEPAGSFAIDLFIGEEECLEKGYGTELLIKFSNWLLQQPGVKRLVIDPDSENTRAIHVYQKAGFQIVRKQGDGVAAECTVMEKI